MNCRKVNSLLSAYVDNEVTGVEQMQIRSHLRTCGCCSDEYESLLLTKRLLSGLSGRDPRDGFEDEIIQRLAVLGASRRPQMDLTNWWSLMGEPQRAKVRMAVLYTSLTAAALLWVTVPMRLPAENHALDTVAMKAPTRLSSPIPVNGYIVLHNRGEDAQWTSSAPTISSASDTHTEFTPAP